MTDSGMDELISRAAAIEAIYNSMRYGEGYKAVCARAIERIPAVDAVPVVHARWRELKDGTEECTNCLGLCPHEENYNGDIIFNFGCEYCPWCGAKMDGERRGQRMKLVDLEQTIFIPVVDETHGGVTVEMKMTVGEFFAKCCQGFEPEVVEAIPVEWLKRVRKDASEGDSLDVGIAEVLDMWAKE